MMVLQIFLITAELILDLLAVQDKKSRDSWVHFNIKRDRDVTEIKSTENLSRNTNERTR